MTLSVLELTFEITKTVSNCIPFNVCSHYVCYYYYYYKCRL